MVTTKLSFPNLWNYIRFTDATPPLLLSFLVSYHLLAYVRSTMPVRYIYMYIEKHKGMDIWTKRYIVSTYRCWHFSKCSRCLMPPPPLVLYSLSLSLSLSIYLYINKYRIFFCVLFFFDASPRFVWYTLLFIAKVERNNFHI
jgi:hypothetical protein